MKNNIKFANVMGVEIARFDYNNLFEYVSLAINGANPVIVAKCPSEFIKRSLESEEFALFLKNADLCIADGVGVLWAAKYLSLPITKNRLIKPIQATFQMIYSGASIVLNKKYIQNPLPERLSGVEVFYKMMEAAEKNEKGVFLFGAKEDVLKKSIETIKSRYPKLKIVGYRNGYNHTTKEMIKLINESKASMLIVALGSPEQEYWIRDNLPKLQTVKVAVGEGGSFDAIAGEAKRAPKIIQKIGLEWLWRMFMAKNLTTGAPPRWKRVWKAVPVFIYETVKWKIKNG